jgi:hypothetical protein
MLIFSRFFKSHPENKNEEGGDVVALEGGLGAARASKGGCKVGAGVIGEGGSFTGEICTGSDATGDPSTEASKSSLSRTSQTGGGEGRTSIEISSKNYKRRRSVGHVRWGGIGSGWDPTNSTKHEHNNNNTMPAIVIF